MIVTFDRSAVNNFAVRELQKLGLLFDLLRRIVLLNRERRDYEYSPGKFGEHF